MTNSGHQTRADVDRFSIATPNQRGRTTTTLNEINEAFVACAAGCERPVLDIGSAYGVASLAALATGATVIANDIDASMLRALQEQAPPQDRPRLRLLCASFPHEIDLPQGSLDAAHASNLFNFLRGEEIDAGLAKLHRWLAPGGRLFAISGTPWAANVSRFIPVYEARLSQGLRWPGECDALHDYADGPTAAELPEFLHLLDTATLGPALLRAGFEIEVLECFHRRHTPTYIAWDGRENVRFIARRPLDKAIDR
ncbi:class I SAM-dependent methyltransferase [Rubrivivax gelatinosus]|uniref:Methyltransferase family protein n=1 Tax=Rubrivivax gelatinosus TaxID=28068 RepID=A0A4R2M173_RUBGE|nr:class I SAM-dependent methyltransferase [Rubrivivax gelatinosus]MBK1689409.1 hypothetical protein [Rubrivivax gelatinosus]TCO99719.1 methyltransferase family protein [Rubrivivax gelatinosus]